MAFDNEHPPRSIWQRVVSVTAVVANIAIVAGIGFAASELAHFRSAEKRRIAIEATSPLRSPEFLGAYMKIADAARVNPDLRHTESILDDLYYVVSVYDNIGLMYVSGLANKEVITSEMDNRLAVLIAVMDATDWPSKEARRNLDPLIEATTAKPEHR